SGEALTDLAQIFIALDGTVKIASPNRQRTIAVEELFLDFYTTSLAEDEILTHVLLPPLPPRSGIDYIRFSSSSVVDKPAAGVAVRLTLNSQATIQTARIVLGCVGATPVRARRAEAMITGKTLTADFALEAGSIASQECSPTSDLRGSEKYKRAIVGTLVQRAAMKASEHASRT
ncbi:MAG TPA: FAD binding domain-containing protein, partial [Candidatus Deferrimicrobium sp.]|nr:FAD binding domain-containing protein [Candidatus Deferrimicrobium sp.]